MAVPAECADWMKLLDNAEGTFYSDNDTYARNTSAIKEVRELSVLKTDKELSRKLEHAEYNCSERKKRVFQLMTHSKTGEAGLISSNNPPWEDIGKDAGSKAFFQFACKQR